MNLQPMRESAHRLARPGPGLLRGIAHTDFGKQVLGLAGVLCLAATAVAAPITYTFSATGSGNLGAQSFSNSFFQLTAMADTSGIYSPTQGVFAVNDSVASVFISGLGTAMFSIGTINVDNQNLSRTGFSDPVRHVAILFVDNPAFATYDLSTSIGPLSGPPSFNRGVGFGTSMGLFSLTDVSTTTFQATLVPEPCALGIWSLGAVVLIGRRARFRVE